MENVGQEGCNLTVYRVFREIFTEKLKYLFKDLLKKKKRPLIGVNMGHLDLWGESVPGTGNRKCLLLE